MVRTVEFHAPVTRLCQGRFSDSTHERAKAVNLQHARAELVEREAHGVSLLAPAEHRRVTRREKEGGA